MKKGLKTVGKTFLHKDCNDQSLHIGTFITECQLFYLEHIYH